MENITVMLYLCSTIPMVPALYLMPERRSRLFLSYLLLGMTVCLIASEVNSWLLEYFGGDVYFVSTNIVPIAEELLKALPVLYYALVFTDKRDTLISISYAIGIGFAVLENMVMLMGSTEELTILWAFVRGFGAARMHSACTVMIGWGISYVNKRRKLFYCGTFSLLMAAVILHALFNTLIQSQLRDFAFIVVLLMYMSQIIKVIAMLLPEKNSG